MVSFDALTWVALALGLVFGAMIPVQTSINSRLARTLGAILPASLVSFTVGTLGLGLAALVTRTNVPWVETATTQPWWIWVGGVCGLVFLTMNIVLLPRIGASATVVLPLVGQVLGGLVIDLTGAFGMTVQPLTPLRGLGATLVVVGATMVNLVGRVNAPGAGHPSRAAALLWVAAILVGTLGAVQIAVNGRLGQVMGSALAAAFVSFLVGAVGLLVVNLVTRQRVRRPERLPAWTLTGGLLGAGFVLANAFNAPILGTSVAISITLLGQVIAGLVLDHGGYLGITKRPASPLRLLGAALVVAGVVLVRFG
ncbi:MAG: DMT family transporter [Actinobacteria bacterium]|nr:DMT family transporter [Actinomycetota bacterium]